MKTPKSRGSGRSSTGIQNSQLRRGRKKIRRKLRVRAKQLPARPRGVGTDGPKTWDGKLADPGAGFKSDLAAQEKIIVEIATPRGVAQLLYANPVLAVSLPAKVAGNPLIAALGLMRVPVLELSSEDMLIGGRVDELVGRRFQEQRDSAWDAAPPAAQFRETRDSIAKSACSPLLLVIEADALFELRVDPRTGTPRPRYGHIPGSNRLWLFDQGPYLVDGRLVPTDQIGIVLVFRNSGAAGRLAPFLRELGQADSSVTRIELPVSPASGRGEAASGVGRRGLISQVVSLPATICGLFKRTLRGRRLRRLRQTGDRG